MFGWFNKEYFFSIYEVHRVENLFATGKFISLVVLCVRISIVVAFSVMRAKKGVVVVWQDVVGETSEVIPEQFVVAHGAKKGR